MARFIVIGGHAGAGKTTLSKQVVRALHRRTGESFCLLDKDTVYGAFSAHVMGLLTGDPHDRDSPTFLSALRNPEYDGLVDTARENLSLDVNVVLCGPFSQEIRDHRMHDPQRLHLPSETRMRVVWVSLDEAVAHQRIVSRADPRDNYKLAHWDAYRQRRFNPSPADYPELIRFDNSGTLDEARLEGLVETLL